MPKAARIGDIGACAIDGPNPLTTGSPDVEINSIPVHRVFDYWSCGSVQVEGSPDVEINSVPIARIGDQGSHGGPIITGSPNVIINGIPEEVLDE